MTAIANLRNECGEIVLNMDFNTFSTDALIGRFNRLIRVMRRKGSVMSDDLYDYLDVLTDEIGSELDKRTGWK